MTRSLQHAFFAYPAKPDEISFAAAAITDHTKIKESRTVVTIWPSLNIVGAQIADAVRKKNRRK